MIARTGTPVRVAAFSLPPIAKDGLGYQVFNAANDDTSSALPTRELLDRFYPNVPVKRELGEYETLLSNRKARDVLGFRQQHNWRKYAPKG